MVPYHTGYLSQYLWNVEYYLLGLLKFIVRLGLSTSLPYHGPSGPLRADPCLRRTIYSRLSSAVIKAFKAGFQVLHASIKTRLVHGFHDASRGSVHPRTGIAG